MRDFALTVCAIDEPSREGSRLAAGFYARTGKRAFDIGFALLLLPVLVPVILVLWSAVRCDGGAGFFGHARIGRNGKPFRCWKLRSMVPDAEARLQSHLDAHPAAAAEWRRSHKLSDDPRVSRLGRVLRKTSLDELPQIWNVLKGEMSFVGPRPIVTRELARYGSSAPAYLAQKPGITGLWQVSGRNDISYDERVALDVAYLTRRSFLKDLKIIAKTGLAVIGTTGR
ncbi:sugar transferase [Leisingera sp. JC11]|uniref:sugar transferase n=1 Tax=Leisingera sp. JC11 TaxID=3042469 RepID=UPI00345341FE